MGKRIHQWQKQPLEIMPAASIGFHRLKEHRISSMAFSSSHQEAPGIQADPASLVSKSGWV